MDGHDPPGVERRVYAVDGVVQGVGFRPFVHRLATGLALAGRVWNDAGGVRIDVEGPRDRLDDFEARLRSEHPPHAAVDQVVHTVEPARGAAGFEIVHSAARAATEVTSLPPDLATCDACLHELFDPADRRYRYPFVNCTDCGPRFTIASRLPYDRPNTTMAGFELCEDCAREYADPADRRFHAQPLACPRCGPQLVLVGADGSWLAAADGALRRAQELLEAGRIVAVKGIGGYHLVCDARQPQAVAELRRRKHRGRKPLAVMVANEEVLWRAGLEPTPAERAALRGPDRPIVLLRRPWGAALAPWCAAVAGDVADVGAMLPYAPLHHLLLDGLGTDVVVCTSGNLSDEPIATDDDDARERLRGIADAWLAHDRPIHTSCDDSVTAVVLGRARPVRRSRGAAPLPVALPGAQLPPLLAMGGDLKGVVCLAQGDHAWLSQHLGDLGDMRSFAAAEHSVEQLLELTGIRPELVAVDAHPGYLSARLGERLAREWGVPVRAVQHHHAHAAAALAEHGRPGPVIAFAFDGTGYGTDGTIWGGEVLVADTAGARRVAHLAPVPLPGGDATIAHPSRAALAHLRAAGVPLRDTLAPVRATPADELVPLQRLLERPELCVPSSSMGRLFDAVASLLDLCHRAEHEAHAAMALEAAADPTVAGAYRFGSPDEHGAIGAGPLVAELLSDLAGGAPVGAVAMRFHRAVAELVRSVACAQRHDTALDAVVLTGGVFQNRILVEACHSLLVVEGFEVLLHEQVPTNDGGLALGQAVVAASAAMRQG